MSEREPTQHDAEVDPYWHVDQELGEVRFWDQSHTLRLRAHIAPERYSRTEGEELVPLRVPRGTRTYVMAKAYILEPIYYLQVQLNREADPSGLVGKVVDSSWDGMQDRRVGEAQAWYYEADRTLVLWECFLEERFRAGDEPAADANQLVWWRGFERFLLARFPEAWQIVTTHADPLYETPAYQRFLTDLGYGQVNERAFGRQVTSP